MTGSRGSFMMTRPSQRWHDIFLPEIFMARVSKRTFSLPAKQAEFERWLRDEVVPVYDAMKADPSRGIPARAVFAKIRARYSRRNLFRHPDRSRA
jgi:hypothetical protein